MSSSSSPPTASPKTAKRILRTGFHPWQLKVLRILTERVASTKEMAAELGVHPVGKLAYHVRALKARGQIEPVKKIQRRGAIETFYKAVERPWLSIEDLERMTPEQREDFLSEIIICITGDFGAALDAGTFGERLGEWHMSRTPLHLDEQGRRDLVKANDEQLDRALEIQAESDQRRSKSGEEGEGVSAILASFPVPLVERVSTNGKP